MPADSRWLIPGGIAGVDDLPASAAGFQARDVPEDVARQGSAAGSVSVRPVTSSWQNSTMPLPFAVLQERAVLEAEAAVEDRQEIAASGLLDQHRSHVAAIAAAPDARHRDVAPLDRGAVAGPQLVLEPRRQERRLAAPVAQVLRVESRPGADDPAQPREDLPQAVLRRRGTRAAFPGPSRSARRRSTFRPSRTRPMSGAGPSDASGRPCRRSACRSRTDRRPRPPAGTRRPAPSSSLRGLALRVEQRDLRVCRDGVGRPRQDVEREGILLGLTRCRT